MAAPETLPDWAVPIDQVAGEKLPEWAKLAPVETAATAAARPATPTSSVPTPTKSAPGVSLGESAARGAWQGATLGFGDELTGGANAGRLDAPIDELGGVTARELAAQNGRALGPDKTYEQVRDEERAKNAAAHDANPGTYTGFQMGGSLVPTVLTFGAGGPVASAVLGAVQGAGYSDATGKQLLADSSLGAGLGLAGFGAGKAISAASGYVRQGAQRAISAATAKAAADATAKEAKILASEVGSLGGHSAALSNDVKWLTQLLEDKAARGALTPENQALLEALRKSPAYSKVLNKAAERVGEELPSRVAQVTEHEAIVSGLQAAMPQAIAEGTAARIAPAASSNRAWGIAKRELAPWVGGAAGNFAADELGLDRSKGTIIGGIAGVVYGRARLGKSLTDFKNMPSTQIFLNNLVNKTASVPQALAPYIPSLTSAATRGGTSLGVTHFLLYNNDEKYRRAVDSETQPGKPAAPPE